LPGPQKHHWRVIILNKMKLLALVQSLGNVFFRWAPPIFTLVFFYDIIIIEINGFTTSCIIISRRSLDKKTQQITDYPISNIHSWNKRHLVFDRWRNQPKSLIFHTKQANIKRNQATEWCSFYEMCRQISKRYSFFW